MTKLFVALACSLWLFPAIDASAQSSSRIQQLEAKLEASKDTAQQLDLHFELVALYRLYNVNRGVDHAHKAWYMAENTKNSSLMAKAAAQLGQLYYMDLADPGKAAKWQLEALRLSEQNRDSALMAQICFDMGRLIAQQGDINRARQYLARSAAIADRTGNYYLQMDARSWSGQMAELKEEKAVFYRQMLQLAEQHSSDSLFLTKTWDNLARYYQSTGQQAEALQYFQKVFYLLNPKIDTISDLEQIRLAARAALQTGAYERCLTLCPRMIRSGKGGNTQHYRMEGIRMMAEAWHAQGNDSMAFQTVMQFLTVKDSIDALNSNEHARQIVLSLQSEVDMQQQKQQYEIWQNKRRYEQTFVIVLMIGFVLLSVISFYLYRERQRNRDQNKKLAQLNQTKNKLLSIISHDVRSPLQALQNILQLFEMDIATKDDVYTVTKQVRDTVQNLSQGLDNLFFWAQNQQQELQAYPEVVALDEAVATQITQLELRIQQKEIELTKNIPASAMVQVDPLHIRLMIHNVLANAIKFTPPAGSIRINTTFDSTHKMIVLSIMDSGRGIPEGDIEKIFDPLVRYTRPGTEGEPGSGLGLSLTRDLLHLNKGDIRVSSPSSGGTLVELIFRADRSML